MKKLIIAAILIFALTSQAYGMGWFGGRGHDSGGSQSSGAIHSNSGGNGALVRESETPGTPVAVPEPTTLLLLGAGLVAVIGLRKKFKK